MNILETKMKIEEVNKLLITYDELDFNKIRETKKSIVSFYGTDTDEEIAIEDRDDKLEEDINRYIEDDSNLDKYIAWEYIEVRYKLKKSYIDRHKLTAFTNQLLSKCNIDKILILMARTTKCKYISICEYSYEWLAKLGYLDSNINDLILDIPEEVICEVINTIVDYKIKNTRGNKIIDDYKRWEKTKDFFSDIWKYKFSLIVVIILIFLCINYASNINKITILTILMPFIFVSELRLGPLI